MGLVKVTPKKLERTDRAATPTPGSSEQQPFHSLWRVTLKTSQERLDLPGPGGGERGLARGPVEELSLGFYCSRLQVAEEFSLFVPQSPVRCPRVTVAVLAVINSYHTAKLSDLVGSVTISYNHATYLLVLKVAALLASTEELLGAGWGWTSVLEVSCRIFAALCPPSPWQLLEPGQPAGYYVCEVQDAQCVEAFPGFWTAGCPQRDLGLSSSSLLPFFSAEVCAALNVTVSPGPVVDYLEGENATLLCHVSQKRRKDSLLAVRWFFARSSNSQEVLMVKMTKLRVVQYYGNFSRSANRQRLRLLEEQRGVLYRLSVLTLQPSDQGNYVCKVQEISKHRNKWTAWSNGSSATEMRVISLKASEESSFEKKKETWAFFEDLYVYAVLVCCVGILSILLFMLVIVWQSVFNKRKSRVRHYLVKCPQNSSGETVTSVTSLAPLQPKKGKRQKEKPDVPPAVPAKAPIAPTFHKPKLLKPQRKVTLPKIAEENLTYAELELIKPHQAAKGAPTSTVYAQILFEENKL
uniref:V-set and transmembrane domain-containing protein 4 n=1 Tax=Saimiri boliviensis boliviensis TaxID=39432 RepID=A0A2K6U9L6_SAIBB